MQGKAARRHGGSAPPGTIDFSAPANPLGPPPELLEAVDECAKLKVYLRYPTGLYSRLLESAAEYLDVDIDSLLLMNGSAEGLSIIPMAMGVRELLVVEPNFGDHTIMAEAAGIRLTRVVARPAGHRFTVDLDEIVRAAAAARSPSLIVISRPNNPTGYALNRSDIDYVTSRLPRGVTLLVDEAFVELSDAEPLGAREDLLVLRSFTKSLASPGLRLGALVTRDGRTMMRVSSVMQAWPIDSVTACAYSRVLQEPGVRAWVSRGRELALEGASYLSRALEEAGVEAFESHAPFVLIRHSALPHPDLNLALVRRGFYVRDASSFYSLGPEYSRVSARLQAENEALVKALRKVLGHGS